MVQRARFLKKCSTRFSVALSRLKLSMSCVKIIYSARSSTELGADREHCTALCCFVRFPCLICPHHHVYISSDSALHTRAAPFTALALAMVFEGVVVGHFTQALFVPAVYVNIRIIYISNEYVNATYIMGHIVS